MAIRILLLGMFMFVLTGCRYIIPWEELDDPIFMESEQDYSIENYKTNYNKNDTIFLYYSIPERVYSDTESCVMQGDSVELYFDLYLINTEQEELVFEYITSLFEVVPIIGRVLGSDRYSFKYNKNEEIFELSFGLVLKNKGKFRLTSIHEYSDSVVLVHRGEQCSNLFNFSSTYKETGNGWFEFEVVE